MIKNVIVLEDSLKVGFGGGQRGSLEVIESLKDTFNVVVFDSVHDSEFYKRSANALGVKPILLKSYGRIVGGSKASFSVGLLELLIYPFLLFYNILFLVKFLKSNSYTKENTVIYSPIKKTLFIAYFIKKIKGIKYVYHVRNFDDKSSKLYKIYLHVIKKAKINICVSKCVLDNLALPNCRELYNTVRPLKSSPKKRNIKKSQVNVVAFASLLNWKGIDYLILSAKHIKSKNVKIKIYGKGSEESRLQSLIIENNLESKVELTGFALDVEEIMNDNTDIICTPSISEEAFGRVPVEGYRFGIPAITTNIGAQAEITKNLKTGLLVNIKSEKEIAKAIDKLVQNEDLYNELSMNSLEYVKEFDFYSYKKKLVAIFNEVF